MRRRVARELRLLVDESTLQALGQLRAGPQTNAELADALGLSDDAVGGAMRRLVGQGLVIKEQDGATARYAARDPRLVEAASRLARLGPLADHPRLLGDPTRLLLLELIGVRERTVSQLCAATDRSSQSVSRHLYALYALRLVDRRYESGRFVYSLTDTTTLEVLDLVAGAGVTVRDT